MKKIVCDRCGGQISARHVHISIYGDKDVVRKYGKNLRGSNFCKECIEDIVDFALNKDTCDECVRAMEAEAAMLRAPDEEAEVSPNMEKYKAVMSTYLGEPVKRDKCATDEKKESSSQKEPDPNEIFYGIALSVGSDRTINTCLIPKEKMAEMLKSIYKNAQWIDGKYVIPLQPVAPELIDNYQSKFKGRQ